MFLQLDPFANVKDEMDADDLIAVLPKIKEESELNIDNDYGGASSSASLKKINASNTSKKVCKFFCWFLHSSYSFGPMLSCLLTPSIGGQYYYVNINSAVTGDVLP